MPHEIEVYFAPFGYITVEYSKHVSAPDFADEGTTTVSREITSASINGDDIREYLSDAGIVELHRLFDAEIEAQGDDDE